MNITNENIRSVISTCTINELEATLLSWDLNDKNKQLCKEELETRRKIKDQQKDISKDIPKNKSDDEDFNAENESSALNNNSPRRLSVKIKSGYKWKSERDFYDDYYRSIEGRPSL